MSGMIRHPDGYRVRFYRLLSANIRAQRHAAGMTIKQMAAACKVSTSTAAKWEEGESMPVFALHQLEVLFGCNAYDLLPVMTDEAEAAQ